MFRCTLSVTIFIIAVQAKVCRCPAALLCCNAAVLTLLNTSAFAVNSVTSVSLQLVLVVDHRSSHSQSAMALDSGNLCGRLHVRTATWIIAIVHLCIVGYIWLMAVLHHFKVIDSRPPSTRGDSALSFHGM